MKRRYLTAEELAESIERDPEWVENMLLESVRGGMVELISGGYRLSDECERCYGQDLRNLGTEA